VEREEDSSWVAGAISPVLRSGNLFHEKKCDNKKTASAKKKWHVGSEGNKGYLARMKATRRMEWEAAGKGRRVIGGKMKCVS